MVPVMRAIFVNGRRRRGLLRGRKIRYGIDLVTFARSDDANLAICTVTAGIRRAAGQTVLRSKFVADSKERRQKLFHFRGNERVAPCLGGEALQVRIGM